MRGASLIYCILILLECNYVTNLQNVDLDTSFSYFFFVHESFLPISPNFERYSKPQSEITGYNHITPSRLPVVRQYAMTFPYQEGFVYPENLDLNRLPYVYLGKRYRNYIQRVPIDAFFFEHVDVFEIPHGYIGKGDLVGTESYLIDTYDYDFDRKGIIKNEQENFEYIGYEYVLAPLYRFTNHFGHWICDAVGPLTFVPEWVWDLDPVVVVANTAPDLAREYINVLGHPNAKIISSNQYIVYAEHLFVAHGRGVVNPCGAHSLNVLRGKLADYYGLHDIKPTNYGYFNKEHTRRFTNMESIVESLSKLKNIQFTKYEINEPDRKTFARAVASLRLLLTPCGSIAYNIVFMKPGTGLLTLNGNAIDGPNLKVAPELNIWHVEVIHMNMDHFGAPGEGNIQRITYSFEVIWYALENQKWPATNLFPPVNMEYLATRQAERHLLLQSCYWTIHRMYMKAINNNDPP